MLVPKSENQMLLTGNVTQNLWVFFPKRLKYYVSLPEQFFVFCCLLYSSACLKCVSSLLLENDKLAY